MVGLVGDLSWGLDVVVGFVDSWLDMVSFVDHWGLLNVVGFVNNWGLLDMMMVSGSSSCVAAMNSSTSMTCNIFFSFWVVNNLGLNWEILNSFPSSFNGFIFNNSLFNFFRNILNLSLNSIIISDSSFDWNSVSMNNFFIFYDFLFIRNSLYSFYSVILDVFLLERNILDSAFNWNFFSNSSSMSDVGVGSDRCADMMMGGWGANISSGGGNQV